MQLQEIIVPIVVIRDSHEFTFALGHFKCPLTSATAIKVDRYLPNVGCIVSGWMVGELIKERIICSSLQRYGFGI